MNIKLKSSGKFSLKIVLLIAFFLVLLAEGYLGYKYLYSNFFSSQPEPQDGNIVRVNLKTYQSTVDYLEGLYEYQPEPLVIPRINPFKK